MRNGNNDAKLLPVSTCYSSNRFIIPRRYHEQMQSSWRMAVDYRVILCVHVLW